MDDNCVIRRLPPDVIKKIAAGEIIVRPSSAIKELIENSIDAGATEIRVNLSCNPLDFCEIMDNGCGVCEKDLRIICKRFTTSKTKDSIDNVKSLGFRGEALSSLSQSAHVTISSRTENEEKRTVLRYIECEPILDEVTYEAGPRGFYLKYENLFYNYETRQKSLASSVNAEFNTCLQLVQKYSIHFPHINFIFNKVNTNILQLNTSNGVTSQSNPTTLEFKSKSNIITSTSGNNTKKENKEKEITDKKDTNNNTDGVEKEEKQKSEDENNRVDYDHQFFSKIYPALSVKPSLSSSVKEYIDNVDEHSLNNLKDVKKCIKNVYGLNIGNNLFELVFNNFDYLFFNCKGLISHPNQPSKIDIFVLFINNRLIELPSLKNLVYSSYSDITNNKYRRFIYLSIFVPYDKIDANIHPSKKKILLEEQPEILQYIGNRLTQKMIEIMRMTSPSAVNENTSKLIKDYKFYKGKFSERFKPRNNYKQMNISHFVTPLFSSQTENNVDNDNDNYNDDDNEDRGVLNLDKVNEGYVKVENRGQSQTDSDDYSPFTSLCNPFGHISRCSKIRGDKDGREDNEEKETTQKKDTDNNTDKVETLTQDNEYRENTENTNVKEDNEKVNKNEEKENKETKEKENNRSYELYNNLSEDIPSFNINNYTITQTTAPIDPDSEHSEKEDTIYNSDTEIVDKVDECDYVDENENLEIGEFRDEEEKKHKENRHFNVDNLGPAARHMDALLSQSKLYKSDLVDENVENEDLENEEYEKDDNKEDNYNNRDGVENIEDMEYEGVDYEDEENKEKDKEKEEKQESGDVEDKETEENKYNNNKYKEENKDRVEVYDHNRILERINKINSFYYNQICETSRLGRIYDVHEVKLLINNINFHKDNDLSKLVLNSSYVGIIDKTYVLVQHKNNLVMMNVISVSRECCHQSIIWRLNNLPSFKLSTTIPLNKILLHSITKYNMKKRVEDLINHKIIRVLNVLFGFYIKDLVVYKLPNILNGYFPGPEYLSDLFYNIFTIKYTTLSDLILKISHMLSYYYTLPPMSIHLKKEVDTNYENFASRVLLSSCQKFQDLCIPKRFNNNGTFIKLANITLLYKIFERC